MSARHFWRAFSLALVQNSVMRITIEQVNAPADETHAVSQKCA